MIKGVNKQIVEINCTKNEYIEKAILFINPQKASVPRNIINQKAENYLAETGGVSLETKQQAIHSKRLFLSTIIGAIAVSVLAVVFHFLYEWTGQNSVVGWFAATNESVFEHTKILFFPFLLYTIIEFIVLKPEWSRFWVAKGISAILLPIVMIAVFYTYTGIVGRHIPIVDMLSAFVYIGLAFLFSYKLIKSDHSIEKLNVIVMPLLILTAGALVAFSILPPNLPLFKEI